MQRLVDDTHPKFVCELEQCSPHSPGVIANDETVAFLLINPIHFDQQRNTVTPDAFNELFKRDLSVIRQSYASADEVERTRESLIERGANQIPPKTRLINEVLIADVEQLRSLELDGSRIVAVYDTALHDKPAHASLFTQPAAFKNRPLRKAIREKLHRTLTQNRLGIDEFKQSLAA